MPIPLNYFPCLALSSWSCHPGHWMSEFPICMTLVLMCSAGGQQQWQCVLCSTSKTPMKRNHPVHGPKTLCNACGVRLSRRVKADKSKVSEKSSTAIAGSKIARSVMRQNKAQIIEECPRTRTERKRSARALDALGLSPDDPEATAHKHPSNVAVAPKSKISRFPYVFWRSCFVHSSLRRSAGVMDGNWSQFKCLPRGSHLNVALPVSA
jgi:hypothetical protein